MSFGGFLGLGEDYYTLPWAVLSFDPDADAYVVDITQLVLVFRVSARGILRVQFELDSAG